MEIEDGSAVNLGDPKHTPRKQYTAKKHEAAEDSKKLKEDIKEDIIDAETGRKPMRKEKTKARQKRG